MELIGKLIELALVEACDRCAIDWYPGDGEPETFEAEAEIECNPFNTGDVYVTLCGVFCIINQHTMECWHSSRLREALIASE